MAAARDPKQGQGVKAERQHAHAASDAGGSLQGYRGGGGSAGSSDEMDEGLELKEGSFSKAVNSPSIGTRYIWRLQYRRGLGGQRSMHEAGSHKALAD